MAQKNYVSLNRLSDFLDNLKNKFAAISHGHTIAEIADYEVDDALSSTSANPVQNKVINDEFEAVATAMNALDLAIDGKTDEAYVDAKVDASIAEVKTDSSNKDAVVLYEAQAYTDAAIANSISQPIIDVLTLPTDNIDTNAFYRSKTANFVANNEIQNGNTTIIYVDALPETGLPAVDLDAGDLRWYYNTSDGVVYGYIDETMSEMASSEGMTVPVGWYPFNTLYEMTGVYCDMAIILVYALPEQGLPALDLNNEGMCLYYNASDNIVYSYITNTLSEVLASEFDMTVPSGWYPFDNFTDLLGVNYGGVITSMGDAVDADAVYILVSSAIYCYNNQWEPLKEEQELIQPDWNQSDNTQPDYIWNKPLTSDGKIYPSYLYQPDWNQTNQYAADFIKNKPAEVLANGKVKSKYLYQPDWDVCDESKPDSVKNRPIYTVPAGTVWYDDICNEFACEVGVWSEQIFYNLLINPELEYDIEWGSLQFFNKKLALNSDHTDLGDSCYISTSINGYGFIHDDLGRITEPSRLKITVAQDYVKKLDEKYLPNSTVTALDSVVDLITEHTTQIASLEATAPPAVTSSDEGKMLQVVDGKLTAVTPDRYKVTDSIVTITNPDSLNKPLNIVAQDSATKIFVCGANLAPQFEGVMVMGVGESCEIALDTTYPAGAYLLTYWTDAYGLIGSIFDVKFYNGYSRVSASHINDVTFNVSSSFNKVIFCNLTTEDVQFLRWQLHFRGYDTGSFEYSGALYDLPITGLTVSKLPLHIFADDGSEIQVIVGDSKELPAATTEDNGKLLQVVDGVPAWVAITNGNEVAY